MKSIPFPGLFLITSAMLSIQVSAASVIGMNFTEIYSDPQVSDGTADGFSGWTDSELAAGGPWRNTGTNVSLNGGGGVRMTWNSSNIWNAGHESNNEQALYRQYLDDGEGSIIDGFGVTVTISGLSDWLVGEGKSYYQIRAYSSTDTDGATFHTISIRDGATTSGTILDTISPVVLGAGDFPTGSGGTWQVRGYGDSDGFLSADTITLTIPVKDGDIRGSLAALKFTAIPEPSAALLCGLGMLGLLRRSRPRHSHNFSS